MAKRLIGGRSSAAELKPTLEVIPRKAHRISRNDISDNALKVLYRLNKAGYEAYLVGGGVRDLLLHHQPKDFDVATNATPEQIRKLFRNCRLVGRRFRLAHILFGRDIIEVATLRGHHVETSDKHSRQDDSGRLLRDNVYGSIDEDAERRDFTVNGLYYDISDYSVRDYFGGMADLKARRLRLIGDPETRYREDPVRMLRAVRFATKLEFSIDKATGQPIHKLGELLSDIPPARLFEESLKLFLAGKALDNFRLMREYGLFAPMYPMQAKLLERDDSGKALALIEAMMKNTDQRVAADKPVTPAFIYAAMLWYVVEELAAKKRDKGMAEYDALTAAAGDAISKQSKTVSLPRRFTTPAMEIWQLQGRLEKRSGSRAFRLYEHPRFRAAYDFLLLRAEAEGGELVELARWWTQFQDTDDQGRRQMVRALGSDGNRRRRRPRRRKPQAKAAQ
ncbi:polynucleotide adenylyltransferase PcnB [Ferrimonas balearica]|uniref:polynucleotide adenylyltransferase PcnB n=1 Tax=Ferrimonas balearica TaxID=44012 RepID=UPI001C997321|nr:polynucleotide adenylyltransferase PcnB [Ferrimonas balearica]MBY5993658.1 polynucleotide adenylyltransferase PcnB [Ferrimonas balearica]